MMDWEDLVLKGLIGLCVAALLFCIWGMYKADVQCKAIGGHWEGTGHYYTTTTFIQSGSTTVPIIQVEEEQKCMN